MNPPLILLTGATGYVGGRLLKELSKRGFRIRCLARNSTYLQGMIGPLIEVVEGDVLNKYSLNLALKGVDVAFYLVHSMSRADFMDIDRSGAAHFGEAASEQKVKRIIYLGGLGSSYDDLSPHLLSRHEVGNILRTTASGVQVVEFRASVVIGSGSLSYEMIKALTERLPVMITPKWVYTMTQPIAIDDLLQFLIKAIDAPISDNPIFEIGGVDRVSYAELMQEYARQRHLKRYMVRVPVLSPRLSSLWLALITPLYSRVGRKLVESAMCPTTVHDPLASRFFDVHPMGAAQAIKRAMNYEDAGFAQTRWIDALSSSKEKTNWAGVHFGGRIIDLKSMHVNGTPEQAFAPIRKIGGATGWYYFNWLWNVRGFMDLLIGGVGFRRGRRDPEELRVGDVVDFWRVEAYEPNRRLLLYAEMKLPGRAWLEFLVEPAGGGSKITQTAIFDPIGVMGILYWYALYPIHHFIFNGMIRGIVKGVKS